MLDAGCGTTDAGCTRVGTGTRFTEPDAVEGTISFGADTSAGGAPGFAFLSVVAGADCDEPRVAERACAPFPAAGAGREERPLRDRTAGSLAAPEAVDADESAPADEPEESAGDAHANPSPLVAAPIPNATAKPP